MSKEDHPIDCPLEIDISSFCSSKIQSPRSIQSIEDLPNLKDLLKQRDSIVSKRARIEEKNDSKNVFDEEMNDESISRHGNYRLFALINHLGGSSDVGEEILPFSSFFFCRFEFHLSFQVIIHRPFTMVKRPVGSPTTTHQSVFQLKITY